MVRQDYGNRYHRWACAGTHNGRMTRPMSRALQVVVGGDGMTIVSQKQDPEQFKTWIDPDVTERVRRHAKKKNRTISETTELLLKWALDKAEADDEREETALRAKDAAARAKPGKARET